MKKVVKKAPAKKEEPEEDFDFDAEEKPAIEEAAVKKPVKKVVKKVVKKEEPEDFDFDAEEKPAPKKEEAAGDFDDLLGMNDTEAPKTNASNDLDFLNDFAAPAKKEEEMEDGSEAKPAEADPFAFLTF